MSFPNLNNRIVTGITLHFHASVAQFVERVIGNDEATSAILVGGSNSSSSSYMETIDEMESVSSTLIDAGKYNLEVEVVLWALRYAQANPTASIEECMAAGYNEWVK